MLIEKIRRGVLQVTTETGTHYVEPSLLEKLLLLWTFRNFRVLPEEVLTQHERQFIGQLCERSRVQNGSPIDFAEPSCVIGTVDRVPPAPRRILRKSQQIEQRCSA
jgi:hypothetical protein